MNNITFQGKTNLFINHTKYDELVELSKRSYSHLGTKSTRILSKGIDYTLETSPSDMAVLLNNENRGFVFHININQNLQEKLNLLEKQINLLQKTAKGKLTAWILGGGSDAKNFDNTIKSVNKVAEIICDRPDIDTSILAGSKIGDDKYTIRTFTNKIELTVNNKKSIKDNLDKLEDHFEIVELNNVEFL